MAKIKYVIIGQDENLRPTKILSRHTTYESARNKLLTGKMPRNLKGAVISKV